MNTNTLMLKILFACLLTMSVILPLQTFAAETEIPKKSEAKSEVSNSVQSEVNKKTAEVTAAKQKELLTEAQAAITETEKALQALKVNKPKEALEALSVATGKLEIVIARNPKLMLAPVSMEVVTLDLLSNRETVKAVTKQAKDFLSDGEIQKARPLLAGLASEIQIRTANIPLETYPAAIKHVTPLIDAGKIDEAKAELQGLLSTLVVTTDVVQLPKLRAEQMLKDAQMLAEKKDRSNDDNDRLSKNIQAAREQLELGEVLGYGNKKEYKPIYQQLDEISKKTTGGKTGLGWFDKVKKQISDLS